MEWGLVWREIITYVLKMERIAPVVEWGFQSGMGAQLLQQLEHPKEYRISCLANWTLICKSGCVGAMLRYFGDYVSTRGRELEEPESWIALSKSRSGNGVDMLGLKYFGPLEVGENLDASAGSGMHATMIYAVKGKLTRRRLPA